MPKLAGVPHRRAVKAFEKAGFWVVREGKHISMTNGERIIIIPVLTQSTLLQWVGSLKMQD